MSSLSIYHNPRCSKSRQTLELIREAGVEPEIVLYLEDVPSEKHIAELLSKLGITARELLRKGEEAYKQNKLSDDSLTEKQLISFMHQFPKLIERPIVVKGKKAVLGRPPENVKALL